MLELGPASAMLLPGYAAADTCVPGAAVDALEIFGGSITRKDDQQLDQVPSTIEIRSSM